LLVKFSNGEVICVLEKAFQLSVFDNNLNELDCKENRRTNRKTKFSNYPRKLIKRGIEKWQVEVKVDIYNFSYIKYAHIHKITECDL
jgi:uncharacterized protein YbcV (DUF1398 family)